MAKMTGRPMPLGPSKWGVGDPRGMREPPPGSELAVIERAASRTIIEMERDGGRPLGMVRALHDNGWEDALLVYGERIEAALMFDERGFARGMYLTEAGRIAGKPVEEAPSGTEAQVMERALLRCAREAEAAGHQEFGVRYIRLYTMSGLELYNPDFGSSACFAFDNAGLMWGLWHGPSGNEEWFRAMVPRLKREGRL